jgi:hypothetical protein
MSLEECVAQLNALADSKDAHALDLANGCIEQFLGETQMQGAVPALGALQAQLLRRPGPSTVRADILDIIGDRIAGLLDGPESPQP